MDEGASVESACYGSQSPYHLLFRAVSMLPITHLLLGAVSLFFIFLYNLFETHFLHDFFFRGDPVSLTFNSSSQLYYSVASKCRLLHARYMATPWLSSPHSQTAFLSFFGNAPDFNYKRELFQTSDGGTIALDWLMSSNDWLMSSNGKVGSTHTIDGVPRDDKTPIMIVIPGLTSDSSAAYIKHLVFKLARSGSDVVVSNHRGLGGISITSDCFYNAGWTEDIRAVIDHLHQRYPQTLLFVVGTSIGANVLVKYLGEQGENVDIAGAAAVCSPWDLLICDRFINRKLIQKFYDKVLTNGLQGYAQMHQNILSRLANWEGIQNSRSVREFDNHATRILGKYETVDTFYRRCSSANFVGKVAVPLLCISSLDDPVCSKEAIPWDECRANENIILATTPHGGHLGFYEGLSASSLWWVRVVDEFFNILKSSPLMHRRPQKPSTLITASLESPINEGPYINVSEGGMVSSAGNDQANHETEEDEASAPQNRIPVQEARGNTSGDDVLMPIKRCMNQLARNSRRSLWLIAYIAIVTTWPLVGSAMVLAFKKKFRKIAPPRV